MFATASAAGIPAVSMIMCGSSNVDHGEVSIARRQVVTVPSGIDARKTHEADLTKVMVNFLRPIVLVLAAASAEWEHLREARTSVVHNALAAASTSSAWPSTFTLGQIRAILPSGPMRKVIRMIPMKVFPYIDFLPHTP
jgi:hypothetical protein